MFYVPKSNKSSDCQEFDCQWMESIAFISYHYGID